MAVEWLWVGCGLARLPATAGSCGFRSCCHARLLPSSSLDWPGSKSSKAYPKVTAPGGPGAAYGARHAGLGPGPQPLGPRGLLPPRRRAAWSALLVVLLAPLLAWLVKTRADALRRRVLATATPGPLATLPPEIVSRIITAYETENILEHLAISAQV